MLWRRASSEDRLGVLSVFVSRVVRYCFEGDDGSLCTGLLAGAVVSLRRKNYVENNAVVIRV